ncbi:hypothetical protein PHAVU_003G276700 [Phaseolus vulgaris]|uniref:Uncharacterized protein n=1 Tax=Phaseolus vulgaris TaxID=3885 RepID=V7CHD8_PHAVU|nr:hypothetical protein PHAVU_003G276700g [Phaseolus vulgaris]ESW28316.1 hypothetical protein PHAVU_003G276700g [Phaseolus vulgaris]
MAINIRVLLNVVIVTAMVLAGLVVAIYYFITKVLYNHKYSITAYQKALEKAATMERRTSVSHHIPAHEYEKKKKKKPYYDVTEGGEDGTCQCFRKRSATLNFAGSSPPQCNRIHPQFFMASRITGRQQPIPQFTTLKLAPGRL